MARYIMADTHTSFKFISVCISMSEERQEQVGGGGKVRTIRRRREGKWRWSEGNNTYVVEMK
jgi:hypothetical protein